MPGLSCCPLVFLYDHQICCFAPYDNQPFCTLSDDKELDTSDAVLFNTSLEAAAPHSRKDWYIEFSAKVALLASGSHAASFLHSDLSRGK